MKLADKVAIVTGAASGFGEGIAKKFAQEGAKIVVADLNDEGGARVVAEIEQAGGTASFVHANVAISEDVAAAVGSCRRDLWRPRHHGQQRGLGLFEPLQP